MTLTLTLVLLMTIGVLIGSIIFLSFVLAPIVFRVLDGDSASRLLRAIFPRYYRMGLICCALGLGTALALAVSEPGALALGCAVLMLAMTGITAYSLRLVPRINAARDSGPPSRFDALHRRSVVLNGVNLAIAIGAFTLAAIANLGAV